MEWRTSLALPDGVGIPTLFYGSASLATLALSPRGERVAFVGLKDGEGVLFLRRFDSFDAVRLTKTEGATAPFFSPDGTRLAFFARGRLWRIDLPGGVPVELTSSAVTLVGGSWGDDGQIVYTPNYSEALWTIPAAGGEAHPLTKVDRARGEISHRWPCVLPEGAGVLFAIKMATIDGGEDPLWNRDGSRLFYSSNGRVVSQAHRSASELRFDAPQAVSGSETPGAIAGFDVASDGSSALVGRMADPLMLRTDTRLWPGWGATLPAGE